MPDFDVRAATIDELLSDAYDALPGEVGEGDLARQRLEAWCRTSANSDWAMFDRRLARDGLNVEGALRRLGRVRRRPDLPPPPWASDAIWIEEALRGAPDGQAGWWVREGRAPLPFHDLWAPIVAAAEQRVSSDLPGAASDNFEATGLADLSYSLATQLCRICAPPLYEAFLSFLSENPAASASEAALGAEGYGIFVAQMRAGNLQRLLDAKPVLLRLLASITRQWIDTTIELISRLDQDLRAIKARFLTDAGSPSIRSVQGGLADFHNRGHTVRLLHFSDGSRILYKPRDLRLDALWQELVERLNRSGAPHALRAAGVINGSGYGWVEYIEHTACVDQMAVRRYFERAGALLCLLHVFAATDVHEENVIAAGEYPIPVDLEMLLQASETGEHVQVPETHAMELAGLRIAESVIMTGLLPDYFRSEENKVVDRGGLQNPEGESSDLTWEHINTDRMRPVRRKRSSDNLKNTPTLDGSKARLGDYVDDVLVGFETYAHFLISYRKTHGVDGLFAGFEGLPTRIIQRPTRFYGLLLERLRDHRNMGDGAHWSAHLDFVSRVTDWDKVEEPLWPLVRAERAALADLNIPYFTSPTDGIEVADWTGDLAVSDVQPGLTHARERFRALDAEEVAWQCEVIRLSTSTAERSAKGRTHPSPERSRSDLTTVPPILGADAATRAATAIGRELGGLALRSGPGAAWIGLDWLGDSEFCRLVVLGPDLYNGAPGISLFLAALGRLTDDQMAADIALEGVSTLRHNLRSSNGPRYARALGLGGTSGIGSAAYALTELSNLLRIPELLDDATIAARLATDELIAADRRLDIIGGSAGGILGLLKLYRITGDPMVLERAVRIGDHLLAHPRVGTAGQRTWLGLGAGDRPLNGMSHGAAGFAYALTSLATASSRQEFAIAADECIAFENLSFSGSRANWPDFGRDGDELDDSWPCQWCHGAGGIGLGRIGMSRLVPSRASEYRTDVEHAVRGVLRAWPYPIDTLCCGSLGNIELLNEAGKALSQPELRQEAARRLAAITADAETRGDFLWSVGDRRFSLGLFRGLAGVGYTLLRQADPTFPNVLLWE